MAESDEPINLKAAEYLASQLDRLMALPLAALEDAGLWEKECAEVQTTLEKRFPTFELEHSVHHFFTDSDIRLKDAGYRERQHRYIADYVVRLRQSTSKKRYQP